MRDEDRILRRMQGAGYFYKEIYHLKEICTAEDEIKITVYFVTIQILFQQICSIKTKLNRWIQMYLNFKK